MAKHEKIKEAVLSGTANSNIRFEDLGHLLERLGFGVRQRGSHHIYFREGVADIINLQPGNDGKAKPYQVRQVADIIRNLKL